MNINPEYLYYIFETGLPYLGLGKLGTQLNLNTETVGDICIPIPSDNEIDRIVSYLDAKCGELDELIGKKRRLLELLAEERSALISRAVTRGLDPKVKLKPSGIDWLGDVPKHWEVKKLKYVLRDFDHQRIPLSADERGNHEKRYDYYGASGVIDQVENYIFDGEYILVGEDGANLLTRSTSLAFRAVGRFWVNNHAHILKPISGDIDFFTHLLESLDYSIYVTGSAQPKLTSENLMSMTIWEPPVAEQKQIAAHIERETARLDAIVSRTEREIELLLEYRTALISEVVTGKIKISEQTDKDKPVQKTGGNPAIRRAVLAAEVVERFHTHQTFGRVKLMKCLYLLENHLQIEELGMEWSRQLAGPYSPKGIGSAEKILNQNQWYSFRKTKVEVQYFPLTKSGGHRKYFSNWFGDKQNEINSLLGLLQNLDWERCEIIATLYGAWNDLIILNETVTDDRIVDEVRNHWHDSKKRFDEQRLKKALGWMREKQLIPTGWGKPLIIPKPQKMK